MTRPLFACVETTDTPSGVPSFIAPFLVPRDEVVMDILFNYGHAPDNRPLDRDDWCWARGLPKDASAQTHERYRSQASTTGDGSIRASWLSYDELDQALAMFAAIQERESLCFDQLQVIGRRMSALRNSRASRLVFWSPLPL